MKPRARHTLGKVERHKIERWLTRRLRDAVQSARANADPVRSAKLDLARELVEMLVQFQEREER